MIGYILIAALFATLAFGYEGENNGNEFYI